MSELMKQILYTQAFQGLECGKLMPWERDLLSQTPMPASYIDPYSDQEVPDVRVSMQMTYSAMTVWIAEARKVDYFSDRFIQLSKMIMNGVTSMGRGLVTLHGRGEDLSTAPMSIHDLIMVASYHFRKSYFGVMQTASSHPDVSEKLLMNQIRWNNMLMRLFKTQDRLAKPVVVSKKQDNVIEASEKNAELPASVNENAAELPSTENNTSISTLGHVESAPVNSSNHKANNELKPLKDLDALFEPNLIAAARSFSSYDKNGKKGSRCQVSGVSDDAPVELTGTDSADSEWSRRCLSRQTNTENEEVSIQNEEEKGSRCQVPDVSDDASPMPKPPFIDIMNRAIKHQQESGEEGLEFTIDEIRVLVSDPYFYNYNPNLALEMRDYLQELDTS